MKNAFLKEKQKGKEREIYVNNACERFINLFASTKLSMHLLTLSFQPSLVDQESLSYTIG